MSEINEKCQVFTPPDLVKLILDEVGYVSNLKGKKILENSCGDGSFLIEIVDRYISDGLSNGLSMQNIADGINSDIYGIEIDKKHISTCIQNLNMVSNRYGIGQVKWNILHGDVLKINLDQSFSYVVGNPPYITFSDLDPDTRQYIRNNYESCSAGKPDYCYAFIESALNCLSPDGRLAYIVPSNIMKNSFAHNLRQMILPSLQSIFDFTTKKVFENKLTASMIFICDKNKGREKVVYHDVVGKTTRSLPKKSLHDKWVTSGNLLSERESNKLRFGDLFQASSSVATLLNEAFIIKEYTNVGNFFEVNGILIESEILRPAVSPRSLCYHKKEYIIFPYYYEEGELRKYSEDLFLLRYPGAQEHLKAYKNKLIRRDADKSAKWYEYGRSQALSHLDQEKILISTLITGDIKIYKLGINDIPYSGIYIVPRGELSLAYAEKILSSFEFKDYIKQIGINANGNSYRISPSDVCNFRFTSE